MQLYGGLPPILYSGPRIPRPTRIGGPARPPAAAAAAMPSASSSSSSGRQPLSYAHAVAGHGAAPAPAWGPAPTALAGAPAPAPLAYAAPYPPPLAFDPAAYARVPQALFTPPPPPPLPPPPLLPPRPTLPPPALALALAPPPGWLLPEITTGVVHGAPATGAELPASDVLWERLAALSPYHRTALLTRPVVPGVAPSVCAEGVPAPVQFGALTVAQAAGGAVRRFYVANQGALHARVSGVALRPAGVPFRVVWPKPGVVIPPRGRVPVEVAVDMLAASSRPAIPPGELQFWCLVGVDCTSMHLHWGVHAVTVSCVVGAEMRADVSAALKISAAIRLDANATPFFPSEFKRCFEPKGRATLPVLCDEERADALIPPGLRRVAPRMGRVFITCPPRKQRLTGLFLGDASEEAAPSAPVPNSSATDSSESLHEAVHAGEESMEGYRRRMTLGLFLEAEQMFTDVKRYDIIETAMDPVSEIRPLEVRIHVQGIAESRPALVLFDPVRLRPTHAGLFETTELIARVVRIDPGAGTIDVKLPDVCMHNGLLYSILQGALNGSGPPLKCHVRFCTGNHFLANQRMVLVVQSLSANLFSRIHGSPPATNAVTMIGRADRAKQILFAIPRADQVLSELNNRQLEAVFLCVGSEEEGVDSQWPVCVFGPPGTGKTRTVTAAMVVALLRHGRRTRILATAPSNQAADVLCERLSDALRALGDLGDGGGPGTMFRLNPYERPVASARIGTIGHVHQDAASGFFDLPEPDALAAYNVIVTTCTSADLLSELPPGHFWAGVFCDEGAQSLQPEALIPLARFARARRARVVLAGDPHQLNADVRSPAAARLGLNESLLEAVMRARGRSARGAYYNVHLRVNYRVQHPALLELPNRMFYDNRLLAPPELLPTAVVAEMRDLFPTGLPLLFAGLRYPEERVSERSPGLINVGEAGHVAELCERLTGAGGGAQAGLVQAGDITVICPYRAQVIAVRHLLRAAGLDGVKVGTVFDTQGQENRVVVVSLTVSSAASMAADESRHDGISSAKKFNVAVTRASELLAVVGNPDVVAGNKCWGALLRHAVRAGCYSGCAFPAMEAMAKGTGVDAPEAPDGGPSTGARRAGDYAAALGELENDAYDEDDFEEDLEKLAEAFRDSEDLPWRVMM